MIAGRSVLAVIPARGGSKGVPRKNIALLAGRPMLAWTIEAARRSRHLDRIVLSSDDPEIIDIARSCGCEVPFVRPASLARDKTPGIDPVLHALSELPGYDIVVLLQPTSPLREADDIDGCLNLLDRSNAPAAVSVREAVDHPFWTYRLDDGGVLVPFVAQGGTPVGRRQELPPAYALNGAVYAARTEALIASRSFLGPRTVAFPMPAHRSIDIDTLQDFAGAEAALLCRNA